jgi:phosphoenolpyruvate phosphomutase
MLAFVSMARIGYLRLPGQQLPELPKLETCSMTLSDLIRGDGVAQIMAAHSPLSAILAEEAGFDGIWASGFELSALYGLPDMSLVSMTQHLDMMRAIAGRTSLPIIADIDTGYGNAINVIHSVSEYERAGAAAVVIEDKMFPKVSSLVDGGRQDLVRIKEFQGKLEAAVDTRSNAGFLVIARTEALIAGRCETEALERAHAYVDAGADMIVVHSKKADPSEIESFSRSWRSPVPLVVIPNSYPQLTRSLITALGNVRMVIYGNYAIRSATSAMQATFRRIIRDGGAGQISGDLAPIDEVFRLQGMETFKTKEQMFLR